MQLQPADPNDDGISFLGISGSRDTILAHAETGQLSTAELEAREGEFIQELDGLEHSYPTDGWDGAAQAIAVHAANIKNIEVRLLAIHRRLGRHRPDIQRYYPKHLCVCGQSKDSALTQSTAEKTRVKGAD